MDFAQISPFFPQTFVTENCVLNKIAASEEQACGGTLRRIIEVSRVEATRREWKVINMRKTQIEILRYRRITIVEKGRSTLAGPVLSEFIDVEPLTKDAREQSSQIRTSINQNPLRLRHKVILAVSKLKRLIRLGRQ